MSYPVSVTGKGWCLIQHPNTRGRLECFGFLLKSSNVDFYTKSLMLLGSGRISIAYSNAIFGPSNLNLLMRMAKTVNKHSGKWKVECRINLDAVNIYQLFLLLETVKPSSWDPFLGSELSKNSAFVHPEINSGFLSVSWARNAGSFSHSFSPDCMVWSVFHSLEQVLKKLFFWMKGLIISLIQNNKRSFFSSEWNMLPLYHIHLRVLSLCLINIHV